MIGAFLFSPDPTAFGPEVPMALVSRCYADGTPYSTPSWYVETDEFWVDVRCDYWSRAPSDAVLDRRSIPFGRWEELDWRGTDLDDPERPLGWLGPDGVMHGCGAVEHGAAARLVFRATETEMSRTFVRVGPSYCYFPKAGITYEQAVWLRLHGRNLRPQDEREVERAEAERWKAGSRRPLRPPREGD